jgi:hypothetical protein
MTDTVSLAKSGSRHGYIEASGGVTQKHKFIKRPFSNIALSTRLKFCFTLTGADTKGDVQLTKIQQCPLTLTRIGTKMSLKEWKLNAN